MTLSAYNPATGQFAENDPTKPLSGADLQQFVADQRAASLPAGASKLYGATATAGVATPIVLGSGLLLSNGTLTATAGVSYTLPPATNTVLGGVKPDGVTMTTAGDGTLAVVGQTARQLAMTTTLTPATDILVLNRSTGSGTSSDLGIFIADFVAGIVTTIHALTTDNSPALTNEIATYNTTGQATGKITLTALQALLGTSGGSGGSAPVNTAAPTISGTAQVGQTLTATQGTWSNSPTSYAYAWKRAGAAISGATSSTYVPVSADVGNALTVTVTATNATGSASATSAATSAVIAAGGGGSYPAMTLSNSPAFNTSTPIQGAASLSAGSGVMASGIVPPNGTQYVTLEAFIRTTAPGYSAQFLRLDDASGHWMAAVFNQGQDNGNNIWHISPQSETYNGVPFSGTAPVPGQRCHVVLQTTSSGTASVWIDGVLNTGNSAATSLSMTDALKATINVSSAGLTAMDSVRLSAGRRYTEGQNFTPPTTMARDSSTMVIYTFDASDGTGS